MHPPYLHHGALIGITCPAGYVSHERVAYCTELLELWGFKVRLGMTVGAEYHYFSGNDDARLQDLQAMLDDPAINAILMGRGGYGMSRIIDRLDFSRFLEHPKWICGFSDITVLHSHLQSTLDMACLHSPMCGAFKPGNENADHIKSLYALLTGERLFYHMPPSPYNRYGTAEGIVTGGNLAMLAHLTGSISEVDTAGKILFIEDVGEYLYNIDRMLMNLKRAGKLDNLKALLIGGFTELQDTERPFGQQVEEIIWDKVAEYNYPVCFNFPAGHQAVNYAFALGMPYKLVINEHGGQMEPARNIIA